MSRSKVAAFLGERIEAVRLTHREICNRVGFERPNMITMLKKGHTKLPLDRVGPIASALDTDPVALLKMCLAEYYPSTWAAIAPFFEATLTDDERLLVREMRRAVGGPYVAALEEAPRIKLDAFLLALQEQGSKVQ